MSRQRLLRGGLALGVLGFLLARSALAQGTLETLLTNGPTAQRVNIVFVSEGYTSSQLGQFRTDALRVLAQLLITPPFNDYSNYFNAFGIRIASTQSGSDHPSRSLFVNTYFNSTYDSSGLARLVTIDSTGRNRLNTLLQTHLPEYDIVALIVNDTEYGGSGGFPLITSVNSAAPEIAIHELGHSFADLGDEYDSPFPGYPDTEEPNTTRTTTRAQIKWRPWILDSTPVPTPETGALGAVIGLFEGAHYHAAGWYRPKLDCKMKALNVPFCEVCSETLVKSIYEQINPVDAFTPGTNGVLGVTNSGSLALRLNLLQPSRHDLRVQWFVNTQAVAGATSAVFTVTGDSLPAGTNVVRADISDPTLLVRTDPMMLLKESVRWRIRAVASPRLSIVRIGNSVQLAWPATARGFRLEQTASLSPPTVWTNILAINAQTNTTVSVSGVRAFFRLRQP